MSVNSNNIVYNIKRIRETNDRIILIDTAEAFDEIQHSFAIKILIKLEVDNIFKLI